MPEWLSDVFDTLVAPVVNHNLKFEVRKVSGSSKYSSIYQSSNPPLGIIWDIEGLQKAMNNSASNRGQVFIVY